MIRRRILLTGATGAWGSPTLRQLVERGDMDVRVLALPTRRDRRALAAYGDAIDVVWGDIAEYADVARAVGGMDVVLHVAAVVSPLADARPELAERVNVASMRHIVRAVWEQPNPGAVAVIGVGSVAETGDRPTPLHWGRVGDPLRPSRFDRYAQSKIVAERTLVDSGLPRWLWLRQTGILGPAMLQTRDPIALHAPIDGVLEWVSDEDSARLLVLLAAGDVPQEAWNRVVNVGGGDGWRLTNLELQLAVGRALGVADIRRWFERNWFATQNFHGQWYTDSDDFAALVPYRQDTFEGAMQRAREALPQSVRMAGRVPAPVMKQAVMRRLAHQPRGPMHAVKTGDERAIAAHFGSLEQWRGIGDWTAHDPEPPATAPILLNHGYDESKPPASWDAGDYRKVAAHRGGALRTENAIPGDVSTRLRWCCADGHEFSASPRLVLGAGHWCPVCVRDPEDFGRQARRNAFLSQVEQEWRGPAPF